MSDPSFLKQVFTAIYNENKWAMGQDESKSGKGSTVDFTISISETLVSFIKEHNIQTMIDTSCGDWNWMKYIQKDLCYYTGIDIVEELIETNKEKYEDDKTKFICTDFLSYLKTLPDNSVDLILCRHTCEHLPKDYIFDFYFECQRVTKYLLLTTKKTPPEELCNQELDLQTKIYRPLNFDLPPFEAFFKPYFVQEFYDGPTLCVDPEMFIYLYKFH